METLFDFIATHIAAIALLCIAVVLRLWVNRRRFYRRGVGGLQHFPNYRSALLLSFFEWLLMLLSGILIVAAILLFITGH